MASERKRKHISFTISGNKNTKLRKKNGTTMFNAAANTIPSVNPWNHHPYSARFFEILEKRKSLPVWQKKEEFLLFLKNHQIIILVGEPGCGKSTQIPQFVLEALELETADKQRKLMVACTQSRRVAAMSVSRRVAEEMDVILGEEVGYSIRFEDCSSAKTVLKYLTDEMLVREAVTDRHLQNYKVIVLDEAHERTLATDVLFGLSKKILKNRPDLKLVVMSATLETEKFQGYFRDAPLLIVPGKLHPVNIIYTQMPVENYFAAALEMVLDIHEGEPVGDILVFLTGEEEVQDACCIIKKSVANTRDHVGPVNVVPLYSTLPPAMQQKIFEAAPPPVKKGGPAGRKIVVSTNIAETSLTIDGIVYVIDSGYAELKVCKPNGKESLRVCSISQASAHQRAGRAGRTQAGKCFRLYTQKDFHDFPPQTRPDMLQSNLANTVLTLKRLGIDDLVDFDFMDPPTQPKVTVANEDLYRLGALDNNFKLTKLGTIMSEFPVDVQMAKMLAVSPEYNCSNEILSIAAMLSAPNCFERPLQAWKAADAAKAMLGHIDGDHLTLLKVYDAFQNRVDPNWCSEHFINFRAMKSAENVRMQLKGIMDRCNLKCCSTDIDSREYLNTRKAILAGYHKQVAHVSREGRYLTLNDNQVFDLHPLTCLDNLPLWVIYNDIYSKKREYYIRTVTKIPGEWLFEAKCAFEEQLYKKHEQEQEQEQDQDQDQDQEQEQDQGFLYG